MLVVLLVLCAVNPVLIGGFPYRRSIVRSFGVWLMLFALMVEHWCLIKGFRIVGPVCGISICSQWILHTKKRRFDVFFHVCPNELLNKQWRCKWVDKPLVASGLPVARNRWSGVLVVQWAAVPSILDSPQKSRHDVFFHVCLNEVFTKQYSCQWVEIPWCVCNVIVACHLSIRYSAWLNIRIIMSQLYWKSNRAIRYRKHRLDLRDKQITCDHGCVELYFKHGS